MNKPEWPLESQLAQSYLQEALRSRIWWSREGQFVKRFQERFGQFVGSPFAICSSSGTAALEIALRALEVSVGDYVIVPSITFIGTAISVLRVGAIPIFADVELNTGCIDIDSMKRLFGKYGNKVKGAIVVHLGGNCCNLEEIVQWAKESKIKIIEDCAQAVGSSFKGRHVGTFGDIGCFSFQNSKNLTSGEGGCLVTGIPELASRCAKYIDYNYDLFEDNPEFTYLCGNYRLGEFQAAVLLAQLEDFQRLNKIRNERILLLRQRISDLAGIQPLESTTGTTGHGAYLFMLRYSPRSVNNHRRHFIEHLQANNIPCWAGYDQLPLHRYPFFAEHTYMNSDPFWRGLTEALKIIPPTASECPVADQLANEFIWIPQFVFLRPSQEMERIAKVLQQYKVSSETACAI